MQHPKTLVVFASPHPQGATARLLDKYLTAKGITEYATFDCYATPVAPCNDCGACKQAFRCRLRDLDAFLEQFTPCTRVIFAFPIYNAGVPAPLKALLDRFQLFFNARFCLGRPKGSMPQKEAALLYTCGQKDGYASQVRAIFEPMFTVMDTQLTEILVTSDTDKE